MNMQLLIQQFYPFLLSNHPISQSPLNSPASSPNHPPNPINSTNHKIDHTLHTFQPFDHNPKSFATFTLRPSCALPSKSNLHWTWIGEHGPFMTNGTLRENSRSNSDTDSDETVLMFNLDRLNEGYPDWVRRDAWSRRQIPVIPNPFIDNLVQRVDRNRLRFGVGDSSTGPQIRRIHDLGQDESWTQYLANDESQVESAHNRTVSLDTGLNNIHNIAITNLGPGPPSPASVASDPGQHINLQCGSDLVSSQVPPKKRFRTDIGRLGRNIRQKLLCGFFSKEGTKFDTIDPPSFNIDSDCHTNAEAPFYPKGCWEADPNQLPQQP